MAGSDYKILSVDELKVFPVQGKTEAIDLKSAFTNFSYYENILSPVITAKIIFGVTDVLNQEGGFELYGSEKVSFSMSMPGMGTLDFTDDNKRLCVKHSAYDKTSTNSIFVVHLISQEAFSNETARVVKRYNGKVNQSVQSILSDVLKTNKTLDSESTTNSYSFLGNTKRPFDVVSWLCPKAVSGSKSPGYFFFETQDGYRFVSAEKLLSSNPVATYTQSETYKLASKNNNYKILTSNVDQNNDILLSLRTGMYSNNSLFYNVHENKFSTYQYKLSENIGGKIKTTSGAQSSKSAPKIIQDLQDYPSRYFVRVLDTGTLPEPGKYEGDANLPKYQAEAILRYNLLYTQSLSITIPANFNLRAGQVIECDIPESTSSPQKKGFESQASGKYVIAELSHNVNMNTAFTNLKLIRDSYEFKKFIA